MTEHTRRSTARRTPRNAAARAAALVGVLLAAALGACTEVGTDPDAAVSLAFDSLPAQAVVVGDTMRDEYGVATRLTAHAFNADDDEIPGAAINIVYLPTDTTTLLRTAITISPDGFLIAAVTAPTTGTYRVVAQAGGLQSQPPSTFSVVPRPDSLERVAPAADADTVLNYAPDSTLGLSVRLLHDTTTDAGPSAVPVPSYPVRFVIDTVPAGIGPVGFQVGSQATRRQLDTIVTATSTDGVAQATVLVRPPAPVAPDSVIVRAYVDYPPDPVRNSPVRLVVRIAPPGTL